jgi:hypothetical protein
MKKYLLILTFLLGGFSMAFAQENQPGDEQAKLERLKALYVAYVTKQLDLTPDEAQRFWPVHTQFENDLKNVNKDLPELEKEQARLNIKKKYQDGFVKIIGTQRFEKFMRLNQEFREKLRKQIQNNHQRQRPIRRGQ